jgi:GTP-binding protein
MRWHVPSRGLIGYRSEFLTDTRGTGTLVHVFDHYAPSKGRTNRRLNGVHVSQEKGAVTSFALGNLQDRGVMLVKPGDEVYMGQIVGQNARDNDLVVNAIAQTVPLYDTYEERIKELRDWARHRARMASVDGKLADLFSTR